jgi:hypothetical protein
MTEPGSATQLKRYTFRPHEADAFLQLWREVARVRRKHGFAIPFALVDRDAHVLTWAVSHPDFAAGAAAYYADPERKAFSRTDYDPASGAYSDAAARAHQRNIEDFIVASDIRWVEAVPLP